MLIIAGVLAIVSLASSAITAVASSAIYDDRPALIVRSIEPLSTTLRPGQPLEYYMTYDKRSGCDFPEGKSEVNYRVWKYPLDQPAWYEWLDYSRPSRAAPGVAMRLPDPSRIPLPALAPGTYGFQFRSIYHCRRASRPQVIDGPIIRFTVVP